MIANIRESHDNIDDNCVPPCKCALCQSLRVHPQIPLCACSAVVMCACDEAVARQFFAHQLRNATELETQRRIPVTLGFQLGICNVCRGIPEEAHPKASRPGRTSKIARYYWREIWFEFKRRFAIWSADQGADASKAERQEVRKRIEKEVIEQIKEQHRSHPKYVFHEESQQDVLIRNRVEVVSLDGTYVKHEQPRVTLFHDGKIYSSEAFAAFHFEQMGYRVLTTESTPFHALFGIYCWLLVQDSTDPLVRLVGFGERGAADQNVPGKMIRTFLPEDFGTAGYAQRRSEAIDEHFANMLNGNRDEMLWKFDYWKWHSVDFRQYIWAHRPEDVNTAREIVCILPPDVVRRVLRYLIGNYWNRFCGWPDLLAVREGEFVFLEVKSSHDKLSEDQKRWIKGNSDELHLPFKIVKIHRKGVVDPSKTTETE